MAEKHEFHGTPKGRGRLFLLIPVLGAVMVAIGTYGYLSPLRDPVHIVMGVVLIAAGIAAWRFAARPKSATITDISFRFERGGKLVFEAIWGEITLVKLGTVEKEGSLMLSVEFQDRRRVMLSSDLDFPERTLEDMFFAICGIKKKYRYTHLRVERGSISRFKLRESVS